MSLKLITETSYDFDLHEGKDKSLYIAGIFSTAEMENNNKRKYGRSILEREVTKVQDKIGKNCLWGELGHPPNPEVNPDKIALKIENLEWKGNNVYGKAKLLDTPMGQIAKTLVKEGSMGISSRGLGTVGDNGYVNEDFHLITYDLVTDPSNKPSWVNGIYEGKEFTILGNIRDEEVDQKGIKEAQDAYFKYLMSTIDNMFEKSDADLIKFYENRLQAVRQAWKGRDDYINFAKGELAAVKSGGMNALIKFWKSQKNMKIDMPGDN